MEADPKDGIRALKSAHARLCALVDPLDARQLRGQSYASEWSIVQVLSHIGSGAEIVGLTLDAGLNGRAAPGRDEFVPIWDRWNAMTPETQAPSALESDAAFVRRLESVDVDALTAFRMSIYGMDVTAIRLFEGRLREVALHTWDIAVAHDSTATLPPDAVRLLIDGLERFAPRVGRPSSRRAQIRVVTTAPQREFALDIGDTVDLGIWHGRAAAEQLLLPAEAFIRLVCGRLDPAHTPALEFTGDLDELRAVFPGF